MTENENTMLRKNIREKVYNKNKKIKEQKKQECTISHAGRTCIGRQSKTKINVKLIQFFFCRYVLIIRNKQ